MCISECVADFVYGVKELEDVFDFFLTPPVGAAACVWSSACLVSFFIVVRI